MQISVLHALRDLDLKPFNFRDVNVSKLWPNCHQVDIAD
jgi:hypothetical protein